MVKEREGGVKTGKRKMRRDQGRAEFVEMDDVRNLIDDPENKQSDVESGEESDASLPQQVSPKRTNKAKKAGAKETLLPKEGESGDEHDHSVSEDDLNPNSSPAKSKKLQIEEQETAEDKERQAEDMKRLEEIRKKREEDKRLRLEREVAEKEAEKKKEQDKLDREKAKEEEKNSPENQAVRDAFAKLLPEVDSQKSLNELNQQNDCKKLLKPLLKKAAIKTLNKAALEKLCGGMKRWKVFEESNVVYLKRAKE